MGSHRKLTSALLAPLAMAVATSAALTEETKPEGSWYSIKALSRGVAEILLYDEIGMWGITAQQFARELKALGDLSLISLRIHSPGGDVFEGTAIYNLLKHHPARVEAHVDGLAASMASVIAMAADTIYMPENALMMVHRPWGIQGGEADDMRRYADLLEKIEETMVAAYMAKTGKSEEEIKALLKAETWMDGREAVEAGFADLLTEPLAAAAQLTSKRMQEFAHMPEAMKNLMQPRASTTPVAAAPNQPPAAAAPAAPSAPAAPAAAVTDEATILARAKAAEDVRRDGIRAVFTPFAASHGDMLNELLLDQTVTVEQAQAKLLAKIAENTTPSAGPQGRSGANAHIHAGNGNLVGDSVRASILARAGLEELQADNRYNYMSLGELARASLVDRGVGVASQNRMQMYGLAFTHTTSDFGNILIDVAHRSLLAGWEEAEETFQLWTKKGFLSDFKTARRVGLGEFSALRQVREGAEYKYVTVGDRAEQIVLATYGELFSITRQTIINDDLSMLTDIPRKMGIAAKGTIGDLVYAVLTGNPALSDGKALFHADHKNLLTGGTSALSLESLSKAKTQMATQKTQVEGDAKARTLNIRPAFVITPVALEDKARQIIESASVPGADSNSGIVNPIRGFAKVIGEARLDDASATAWYQAARQGSDTIEVAYLDGNELPYMEQQQGFTVDGVATKVRIDAGVAPLDFRGLQKANGA
ncbi:ClpP-like prohead protease/major capsid protein fusion protein [Pseudomonas sp. SO81]|uniref:ClpP-like prohead protease/major capsid protein fusion protein n=1 Tax=Pseudomonas sp. SO81 TaxID=2983246 RepID=UPI0025A48E34|nr:ClpP-like prohead protease/major capsid protein fusion protein [Pseudomonas sp. SO81]WJN60929.1 Prophage Clp protease-like protein [Pseudomonas sp. SO81]